MNQPEQILRDIKRVEPISPSALRIVNLVGDPDHGVAEVVGIAQRDPALTANILRAINDKRSLKLRRNKAGRNPAYMAEIIGQNR